MIELIDKYADDEALITDDVGTPMLWGARYLNMNGKRRFLNGLKHGSVPRSYGFQKAFSGLQVISLSGNGDLAILMGDLLTVKQENLPIKIVVFNNSSLNFVERAQKDERLIEVYVDMKNGDFKPIANGLWLQRTKCKQSFRARNIRSVFWRTNNLLCCMLLSMTKS